MKSLAGLYWRAALWLWPRLPEAPRRLLIWVLAPKWLVAVVAVIGDDQERLLLVRHPYRGRHQWALPGGFVRRGEAPQVALVRELREETAWEVAPVRLLDVAPDSSGILAVVWAARITGGAFRPSAEVSDFMWLAQQDPPPELGPDQERLVAAARRYLAGQDAAAPGGC